MWHFLCYIPCFSNCFLVFPSFSISISKVHCLYNYLLQKLHLKGKYRIMSGQQARQLILQFFHICISQNFLIAEDSGENSHYFASESSNSLIIYTPAGGD